jgi:undecaprenyl-diphosphatase
MKIRLPQRFPVVPPARVALAPAGRVPSGILIAASVLAASWAVAATLRATVDYPLVRALDVFARLSPATDGALAWITTYYLLSGVLFVSLIWCCWFGREDTEQRSRLLAGTLAAWLGGAASRVLQLTLPTHLRPMHDPALSMTLPASVDPAELNHWSSFPSDHAAVQFGLACVVYLASPRLGRLAFAWAALLNVARIYLGAHFPTDVTGGAALGVLAVLLAQGEPVLRAARGVLFWARRAPGAFYLLAFFISYQIATLFDEARTAAAAVLALLRGLLSHGAA